MTAAPMSAEERIAALEAECKALRAAWADAANLRDALQQEIAAEYRALNERRAEGGPDWADNHPAIARLERLSRKVQIADAVIRALAPKWGVRDECQPNEALKCEGVITPVMAPAIQVDKTRCGFCVMETRGLIEGAFFAICPDCVENCAAAIRALAQKGE